MHLFPANMLVSSASVAAATTLRSGLFAYRFLHQQPVRGLVVPGVSSASACRIAITPLCGKLAAPTEVSPLSSSPETDPSIKA